MLLDYQNMMKFALSELHMKPEEFWALTPYEFSIMSGLGVGEDRAMTRNKLELLMQSFPDEKKQL